MPDRYIFIANCISNILSAPCTDRNTWQRALDLTEAMQIAANSGEEAAHTYLIQLSTDARNGKYTEE